MNSRRTSRTSSGSSVEVLPDPSDADDVDSERLTIVTSQPQSLRSGDSDTDTVDLNRPSSGSKRRPTGGATLETYVDRSSTSSSAARLTKDTLSTLPKSDGHMLKVVDANKRRKLDPPRHSPTTLGSNSGKMKFDTREVEKRVQKGRNIAKTLKIFAQDRSQVQPISELGKSKPGPKPSPVSRQPSFTRQNSTTKFPSSSSSKQSPASATSSSNPRQPSSSSSLSRQNSSSGKQPSSGSSRQPSSNSRQPHIALTKQPHPSNSNSKQPSRSSSKPAPEPHSRRGYCYFCRTKQEVHTSEAMRTHYLNCEVVKKLAQQLEKNEIEDHLLAPLESHFYTPKKNNGADWKCHHCNESLAYYQCSKTKVAKILHVRSHGIEWRVAYNAKDAKHRKRKASRDGLSQDEVMTMEVEPGVVKYIKAMEENGKDIFSPSRCRKCGEERFLKYMMPPNKKKVLCWLCKLCPYRLCKVLSTRCPYFEILGDLEISKVQTLYSMYNNPDIPDRHEYKNLLNRLKLADNSTNRKIFEVFVKGTNPEDLVKRSKKLSSCSSSTSSSSSSSNPSRTGEISSLPSADDGVAVLPDEEDPSMTPPILEPEPFPDITPLPPIQAPPRKETPNISTAITDPLSSIEHPVRIMINQGPILPTTVSAAVQTDPEPTPEPPPPPPSPLPPVVIKQEPQEMRFVSECGAQTEPSVAHFSAQYIASSVDSGTQVENRGWNDLGWIVAACGHEDVGKLQIRELGGQYEEPNVSQLRKEIMKKGFLELCYFVQGKLKKLCHLPLINAFLRLSVEFPDCKLVTDSLLAQLKSCCLSLVHWSALRDLGTSSGSVETMSAVLVIVEKELCGRLTGRQDTLQIWKRIISQAPENLPPVFWITTWPLARSKLPLSTLTSLVLEKWFSQIEKRENLAALRPEGLPTPDTKELQKFGINPDNLTRAFLKPAASVPAANPPSTSSQHWPTIASSSAFKCKVESSSRSSGLTSSGTQYELNCLLRSGASMDINSRINVDLPENSTQLIPIFAAACKWDEAANEDINRIKNFKAQSLRELDRIEDVIRQAEANKSVIMDFRNRVMAKFQSNA